MDYERGAPAGYVRFSEAEAAERALKELAGEKLGDKEVAMTLLSGAPSAAAACCVLAACALTRFLCRRG